MSRTSIRRFLYRRWPSFLSGILIILCFTLLDSSPWLSPLDHEVVTMVFILVATVILIPVRDYLIEPFLTFPSWETLLEAETHHLAFLARPFTLQALLREITPELLIWLKIPNARLFILQQDRLFFEMHVLREGELRRSRLVSRQKLLPITGMFRQYGRVARLEDPSLPAEVSRVMERYHVAIAVPFLHRGRLMGVLTLRQPTQHRYAERGLELFAAKAAITIHDHILKSRMQNIAEYDQELRVAEKIRQMLQMQEAPQTKGWIVETGRIRSATLVEFFSTEFRDYAVLLSMRSGGGVAAMILSGALGYLFTLVRMRRERLRFFSLMANVREYLAVNDLSDRLEILVLGLRPEHDTAEIETTGRGYQLFDAEGTEHSIARSERTQLPCPPGGTFSLRFHNDEILKFSRTGTGNAA